MADAKDIICSICGTKNGPNIEFCSGCGIKLDFQAEGVADESIEEFDELDNFLESILDKEGDLEDLSELTLDEASLGGTEALDEDALLESLLDLQEKVEGPVVAEEPGEAMGGFECPLCGTMVQEDSIECPVCHAEFMDEGESITKILESLEEEIIPEMEEVVEEEPAPAAPAPVAPAPTRPAPAPVARPPAVKPAPAVAKARPAVPAARPRPAVRAAPPKPKLELPRAPEARPREAGEVELGSVSLKAPVSRHLLDGVVVATLAMLVIFFSLGRMYSPTTDLVGPFAIAFYATVVAGSLLTFLLIRMRDRSLRAAEQMLAARDYRSALDRVDRAIKFTSSLEEAWTNKGVILKRAGRHREAIVCYRKALEINPGYAPAWLNMGDVLLRDGKVRAALRCYNNSLRLEPEYDVAWNNRGVLLEQAGRLVEANRCYAQALNLTPSYAAAWINRGLLYMKLGQSENAAKCYQQARSLVGAA